MRVKAKFPNGGFGFYGGVRRRDGAEFVLEKPEHFSEKWMVKLDESKPRRGKRAEAETTEDDAE